MKPSSNNPNLIYSAVDLVRFMWDKKWILITPTAVAIIISVFVSLGITPRYRSQVILFPAASVPLSKNMVETTTISMDSRDVFSFGGDAEAERLLQILHSDRIKDYVIKKFDLMNHYKIDPASKYPRTEAYNAFRNNVKVRRTQYMSIEINVLDTDPQMAADIANGITSYIDSSLHSMQIERAQMAFEIVDREYKSSEIEIHQFSDSLQKIRKMGVTDYDSQASSLNTAYANALEKGNSAASSAILSRIKILSEYGGKYVELSQKLHAEIERHELLKAKYASYKVNIEHVLPQIFVVDKAMKDEKKASPKRSLIVMISTLSTFGLALLLLLIVENIKAGR